MAATAKQYELLFQLTARLGPNFAQSFKNASSTMNTLKKGMDNINSTMKDVTAYQRQQNAVEKSREKIAELEEEHERLVQAIEETGGATPELTRKLQANEKALTKARDATASEEEKLQELSETLAKAGVNTNALDKETQELTDSYAKLEKTQEKVQAISEKQAANKQAISQTKSELTGLLGTVTAIGAAIYAGPVQNAIEFQSSMAKVSTIADESLVPMSQLRQEIIALSNETGKGINDLAEDVYSAISAGQSTSDAVGFVTNATKLATAGFAESAQAVDVLSTILNAYGMEASKVTVVSDMLINTQNKGKTTVAELASSMGKIIPTANANNVALEQVCAGYEKLTAKGIATAEATTYMNSMLNELGKTGSITDKLLREKTGKSFKQLMANGHSLADVLEIVKNGAESSGLSLSDMFGSAEAGKAALSMMSDGVDSFNKSVKGMIDSCGATEDAYAKMMDTTETKVAKAKNSISNLGTVLGDMLVPYVGQAAEVIADLATKVATFAQENPEVIKTIAKVVAGLVALKAGGLVAKLGFLQVKGGILSVQKAFTLFKGLGITKTLSGIGGGFGGIVGKILPLIGVITAVGGAVAILSGNIESVRGFIQKTFGEEAVAIFDKLWGVISPLGAMFKEVFSADGVGGGILGTLKELIPPIVDTLKNGLMMILPVIVDLVKQIVPFIAQLVQTLLPILAELFNEILGVLLELAAQILPVIVELIQAVLPIIIEIAQAILPVIVELAKAIMPILIQLAEAILPVILQLVEALMPIINFLVENVLPIIIELLNIIVPILTVIIEAILPVFKALLESIIPVITVLAELFARTLGAALEYIVGLVQGIIQVFQGLIDFIAGIFTADWSAAWQGIKDIFCGVFNGLGEVFKAPFRAIVNVINMVIRGLNKLKIPDWVPLIGGAGFNIPEIPGFKNGTNRTPDTFIAGEEGPELIVGAPNRKVFTAAQTGQIFNNMAQANELNSPNTVQATMASAGTITLQIHNAPQVIVQNGGDTGAIKQQLEQYDEEFLEKIRAIIVSILREQREQEGRVAYV